MHIFYKGYCGTEGWLTSTLSRQASHLYDYVVTITAWRSCFPKVWTVWRDRHNVRRLLRNGDLVYIDVESYGQHGLTDICIDGINLDIAEQRVDLHRRRVVRLSVNICIWSRRHDYLRNASSHAVLQVWKIHMYRITQWRVCCFTKVWPVWRD